jgi:Kef-type K+ transport system membrane component KefB/voltage-gated potassium channel Kch
MSGIVSISLVLLVVLIVTIIIRVLRQPLIVGYIISGILVGPLVLDILPPGGIMELFSTFGVAFLLFLVGLSLSPKVIKDVGKISLVTGLGQVVFTSVIGYFICVWMGFSAMASIYISVALTFSSTIIIMKLLSDKEALEKLYGRISVGFLLVQDLIAIVLLSFISSFNSNPSSFFLLVSVFSKGIIVFAVLFLLGLYVFPRLESFFARSQEFLFLFAIVFGLCVASLFYVIGLSLEVGALVAGVVLSMSSYSRDVGSKLRPLRDFFIISFFIILGSGLPISNVSGVFWYAVILSLFVLIGNPIIVMILMGIFGYSKKTGFMAGLTVAQISEFSLILIGMGVKAGHLTEEKIGSVVVNIPLLVTLVGLITIAGSTYLILYSEKLYKLLENYLSWFERKNCVGNECTRHPPEYVLLGENRVGFAIMEYFKRSKKNYLIVDFNPSRVNKLCSKGVNCLFGDVSNSSFLEDVALDRARMVVSTIPEVDTNLMIVRKIRETNKHSIVVVSCSRISESKALYSAGADYVIVPNVTAGETLASLLERLDLNRSSYIAEAKKQSRDFGRRLNY